MSYRYLKKDPITYIEHLNSQAKLKKSKTLCVQNEVTEREQNFQLFFSGANDAKFKQKLKKNQENIRNSYIKKVVKTAPYQNRKRWETPPASFILKENESFSSVPDCSLNPETETNNDRFNPKVFIQRVIALPTQKQKILIEKLEELENSL
jgi:hypothetical protein